MQNCDQVWCVACYDNVRLSQAGRGGRDNNINAFTSFAAQENKLKDLLECKEVEQYHFPTLVISGKDKEQTSTVAFIVRSGWSMF